MTIKTDLITQSNVTRVAEIVEQQTGHPIVVTRHRKNVEVPGSPSRITKESLWHAQMLCLLTSQQPSSQGDPVWLLLSEDPFPISYEQCLDAPDVYAFVRDALCSRDGIRFRKKKIPRMAARNFDRLEAGGWYDVKQYGNALRKRRAKPPSWTRFESDRECEELAADYMDEYAGFGPKQCRNFWQTLGLTRYVCVLDSRIQKWCQEILEGYWLGFEVARRRDYADMADTLRDLCVRADVLPCMFDAAVFSVFERDPSSAPWCR